MSRLQPVKNVTKEKTLAQAVDTAREALLEITTADSIGEHRGVVLDAERVLTHAFACELPGYVGWFWAVTLARASRSRKVTINELSLKPGPDALDATRLGAVGGSAWSRKTFPGRRPFPTAPMIRVLSRALKT